MKNLPLLAFATVALLPLTACNSKSKSKADAAAAANEAAATNAAMANVAAVEMPPPIRADKSFRCKDNSLAFITFFQGDKQAVYKDKADGTAVLLKAETAGEPLTAEGGYILTGDEKAVMLTRPGKEAVSCHV